MATPKRFSSATAVFDLRLVRNLADWSAKLSGCRFEVLVNPKRMLLMDKNPLFTSWNWRFITIFVGFIHRNWCRMSSIHSTSTDHFERAFEHCQALKA